MVVIDSNPTPIWNPTSNMNNEDRIGGLNDQFSRFGINESNSDRSSIHQIINAVEVAQSTIIQQMEENQLLKDQISRQTQELEKFKLESSFQRPSSDIMREEGYTMGTYKAHESQSNNAALDNPLQSNTRNQQLYESTKLNGMLQSRGIQNAADSIGVSQLSTPSSRSLSPTRHIKDGEYDSRFHSPGQGLIPILDTSSNKLWKQDLAAKVREREEEISLLKKHLADYSVKVGKVEKLQNEKCILEKRIAYMRMAFDQQQQDLVDAASKALSYRQDIMEENIRLTYVLQAAQQERSTFISSLLPLLTEYSLQPSVLDAQSIVSNLKVLLKHLQERLVLNEDSNAFFQYKLNESQLQLTPWHAEASNTANYPPPSPSHSFGATLANPNKSLEIVPQPSYSHAQSSPMSSHSNAQINRNNGFAARNSDPDGLESMPPSVNRNTLSFDTSTQEAQSEPRVVRFTAESNNQNQSFKDLVRNEVEAPDSTGLQHSRESAIHWTPTSSPYMPSGLDDPNSSYPYLPPVLEEPNSSFSEAAEDDPLPGIDGLQISGEAFPGRELQAAGYSINGTTTCNFEWVRYLEDGSVKYIEGAKQPKYLVTADDVDSYLAIEVHPLDDRKRKGGLVKVFANEQKKITCDPEMREQLERALSIGHVSYEVLLSAQYLDMWEPAVLAIKKEGYSIKCNGPRGVVMTEKFTPTTDIIIPLLPNAHPADFLIHCSDNEEYLLRAKDGSWLRDTIVLTMRLFRKMALEKKKGRKKGLFFKS